MGGSRGRKGSLGSGLRRRAGIMVRKERGEDVGGVLGVFTRRLFMGEGVGTREGSGKKGKKLEENPRRPRTLPVKAKGSPRSKGTERGEGATLGRVFPEGNPFKCSTMDMRQGGP